MNPHRLFRLRNHQTWLLVLPGVALVSPLAAFGFPIAGSYGFDWLHPRTTCCRLITASEAATLSNCVFIADGNAFGLPLAHHVCRRSSKSELLIYATQPRCEAAFATMQSHSED